MKNKIKNTLKVCGNYLLAKYATALIFMTSTIIRVLISPVQLLEKIKNYAHSINDKVNPKAFKELFEKEFFHVKEPVDFALKYGKNSYTVSTDQNLSPVRRYANSAPLTPKRLDPTHLKQAIAQVQEFAATIEKSVEKVDGVKK